MCIVHVFTRFTVCTHFTRIPSGAASNRFRRICIFFFYFRHCELVRFVWMESEFFSQPLTTLIPLKPFRLFVFQWTKRNDLARTIAVSDFGKKPRQIPSGFRVLWTLPHDFERVNLFRGRRTGRWWCFHHKKKKKKLIPIIKPEKKTKRGSRFFLTTVFFIFVFFFCFPRESTVSRGNRSPVTATKTNNETRIITIHLVVCYI